LKPSANWSVLRSLVMSATRLELEMTLFNDPEFDEKVSRFAQDSSIMVAYITKEIDTNVSDEETEGKNGIAVEIVPISHLSPLQNLHGQRIHTYSLCIYRQHRWSHLKR
jgi:hypothetical protein